MWKWMDPYTETQNENISILGGRPNVYRMVARDVI